MKPNFKDLLKQVQNYPKWTTDKEFNINKLGEVETWCKHTLFLIVQIDKQLREMLRPLKEGESKPYVPLTVEAMINTVLGEE